MPRANLCPVCPSWQFALGLPPPGNFPQLAPLAIFPFAPYWALSCILYMQYSLQNLSESCIFPRKIIDGVLSWKPSSSNLWRTFLVASYIAQRSITYWYHRLFFFFNATYVKTLVERQYILLWMQLNSTFLQLQMKGTVSPNKHGNSATIQI